MADAWSHYCNTCDEYLTARETEDHTLTHGTGHEVESA